jgi:dihydrodipicolinate synthase/N-acetylneuraminate lyase
MNDPSTHLYNGFKAENMEVALALQKELLVIIRTMFSAPFPVVIKMGLEMRGFSMGPAIFPLSPSDIYRANTVRSRLKMVIQSFLERIGKNNLHAQ